MTESKPPVFDADISIPSLSDLNLLDLPGGTWPASEIVTGAENWYRYAVAYKEAADRLSKMSDTYALNILGAPIVFLYRHSIELHLKSLLIDAGELLDDPQKVPPLHYLETLWKRVRALLLRVDGSSEGPWLARADGIIKQFDELDPNSMAFRYPADNDGASSLPETLRVDMRVVRRIVDELHIVLNGASAQISEYHGLKHEGY